MTSATARKLEVEAMPDYIAGELSCYLASFSFPGAMQQDGGRAWQFIAAGRGLVTRHAPPSSSVGF
jgi:hypothetical protein